MYYSVLPDDGLEFGHRSGPQDIWVRKGTVVDFIKVDQ